MITTTTARVVLLPTAAAVGCVLGSAAVPAQRTGVSAAVRRTAPFDVTDLGTSTTAQDSPRGAPR